MGGCCQGRPLQSFYESSSIVLKSAQAHQMFIKLNAISTGHLGNSVGALGLWDLPCTAGYGPGP